MITYLGMAKAEGNHGELQAGARHDFARKMVAKSHSFPLFFPSYQILTKSLRL